MLSAILMPLDVALVSVVFKALGCFQYGKNLGSHWGHRSLQYSALCFHVHIGLIFKLRCSLWALFTHCSQINLLILSISKHWYVLLCRILW